MKLNRRLMGAALALAIAAIAFGIATLGAPRAEATCLAPNTCGPSSPPVICSNHHVYANICKGNAACQYNCRPFVIAVP